MATQGAISVCLYRIWDIAGQCYPRAWFVQVESSVGSLRVHASQNERTVAALSAKSVIGRLVEP